MKKISIHFTMKYFETFLLKIPSDLLLKMFLVFSAKKSFISSLPSLQISLKSKNHAEFSR